MKQNLAIGVDIGGSHISCAAVDLKSLAVLHETRTERPVDNKAEASEIIGVWVRALSDVIKKLPAGSLKGIGFGMPGPFDYVKGISYIKGVAKYENLYGCNVKNAIADNLGFSGDFPVRFMNDVSTFAVGEALVGKASKAERSMAVTLGTGFGSAFISNRIPIVDGPEVPKLGCVYHLPYGDNIADDYFSTRWFIGRYKKLTGRDGMGGGDAKLLALIGAFLGIEILPGIILLSAALGLVAGLGIAIRHRSGRLTPMPYGPFLSLATVVFLFCQDYFTLWL